MDIILKDLKERLKYLETNPWEWSHDTPEQLRSDIRGMEENLKSKKEKLVELENRLENEKKQLKEVIAILERQV